MYWRKTCIAMIATWNMEHGTQPHNPKIEIK